MISKKIFDSTEEDMNLASIQGKRFFHEFNRRDFSSYSELSIFLKANLGHFGKGSFIKQPFRCDIGKNIFIQDNVYIDFNCIVLDELEVYIGNNVIIGPNVTISGASHPISATERSNAIYTGDKVIIEDDVWIGAGAKILDGIVIRKGTIVCAGAVVTKNTEEFDIVAGVPAKTIGSAKEIKNKLTSEIKGENIMLDKKNKNSNVKSSYELHQKARRFFKEYNALDVDDEKGKIKLLKENLGAFGEYSSILQPFYCDVGSNIFIGENVYINYNCTILDGVKVSIGNNVLIAPNVSITATTHPIDPDERRRDKINKANVSIKKPVVIEDDVWIGMNAVILPGVTIRKGTIVGAGAVVTKSTGEYEIVAGVPAKKIGNAKK